MGKMIPEFVPKKQAQFRPISGDPYSDSEAELDHPSPSKISELSPGIHVGPKRFVPLVPGAAVQPKTLPFQGSPADALCTTTDLGGTGCLVPARPVFLLINTLLMCWTIKLTFVFQIGLHDISLPCILTFFSRLILY